MMKVDLNDSISHSSFQEIFLFSNPSYLHTVWRFSSFFLLGDLDLMLDGAIMFQTAREARWSDGFFAVSLTVAEAPY